MKRREEPLGPPPPCEPPPRPVKRILSPYFRKGGATGLTASGFPTGGRAHPSVSGGSLVRSCREKNLSSCRTAQKVLNQHGRSDRRGQARLRSGQEQQRPAATRDGQR